MKHTDRSNGFTIVEILVVVLLLGVLIGITAFSYRNWQTGIAQRQAQSDLQLVSSAMDNAKNFSKTGYPASVPSTFTPSSDVSVTYVGGNSTSYCVQAQSSKIASVVYYIDSVTKKAQAGTCGASYNIAKPVPSVSSPSSSSIVVTWGAVTGATSYSVRYGTSTPVTVAGCASSPCTISGLSADTNYVVTVSAASVYSTAVSNTAGVRTQTVAAPTVPAPSGASVAFTTSRVKVGVDYYQRYVMTASGGTCSVGTTEWSIGVTGGSSPSWSSWPWQASNTKTSDVPENGIYSATDVTIYAKPRCVSGTNNTEGAPATAYNGTGGGGGAY